MQINLKVAARRTAIFLFLFIALAVWHAGDAKAMTATEAKDTLAWQADLKGVSRKEKETILESFCGLVQFISVRDAYALSRERIRQYRSVDRDVPTGLRSSEGSLHTSRTKSSRQ